jgi:ubiquinol-cytochrome c reductase cytochrome b subunit
MPFTPYATVKDAVGMLLFLTMFAVFVFYAPEALGHTDNYVPANPLQTPNHIVPEWYMLPFYAILRCITFDIGPITAKLIGVILMFSAIAVIFALPWLDTSKVRSMRYRPVMRWFFVLFVIACLGLGWCGGQHPTDMVVSLGPDSAGNPIGLSVVTLSQILTLYYFAFFLVIMPWIGLKEDPLPQPASISEAVLSRNIAKKEH